MNTKQRAAFFSIISNTVIVLLKIFVGLAVNSISVISEGIHSALDLISALIAYITVGKSAQPADHTHPYGHGKFENISGLIEASLISHCHRRSLHHLGIDRPPASTPKIAVCLLWHCGYAHISID